MRACVRACVRVCVCVCVRACVCVCAKFKSKFLCIAFLESSGVLLQSVYTDRKQDHESRGFYPFFLVFFIQLLFVSGITYTHQ